MLHKKLLETQAPRHFAGLVKLLDANGGGGFFVGNKVSSACNISGRISNKGTPPTTNMLSRGLYRI